MKIRFYIRFNHNARIWKGVYDNRGYQLPYINQNGREGAIGTRFLDGLIESGKVYLTKIKPND